MPIENSLFGGRRGLPSYFFGKAYTLILNVQNFEMNFILIFLNVARDYFMSRNMGHFRLELFHHETIDHKMTYQFDTGMSIEVLNQDISDKCIELIKHLSLNK